MNTPAIVPATIEENEIRVSVKPDPHGDGFDFLVSVDGGPWQRDTMYPQIDALSIWIDAKAVKF